MMNFVTIKFPSRVTLFPSLIELMTTDQKDTMLANILEQVHTQIMYLTEEGRLDDAVALYQEWEDHFDDSVTEVHVVTMNNMCQ